MTEPRASHRPGEVAVSVVVPTVGRPSLLALLTSLAESDGPLVAKVVVVDDRPDAERPLPLPDAGRLAGLLQVCRSGGRGPAAARNLGWRATDTEWVAFLDDDVRVSRSWLTDLQRDLAALPSGTAASQGRIVVPLTGGRRPTDWERNTAGLASARWITADMAYRRSALAVLGGFDERFPRAFREDADLALRARAAGYRLVVGARRTEHPVRPAPWWASVAQQRGNADDVLMRRVHGPGWQARAGTVTGRRPMHLVVTGAAVAALSAAAFGRWPTARALAAAWAAGTGQFAWARIAPGPRDAREVARMLATSVAIPPAATLHWARGLVRHRDAGPWPVGEPLPERVAAILVDRDGTIVRDVPYNRDPALVQPMPGARQALHRARAHGLPIGVVSNQSGVGAGRITPAELSAVNDRVEALLGPFDDWQLCVHSAAERCECRKPRPALVRAAADALGVDVAECVLIGDVAADVQAARAAGATGVLVPTPATRAEDLRSTRLVFPDIGAAVDEVLARCTTAPGVRIEAVG
jgi:histidinol-phosphate phosphatase family protein